jgi:hypothetical protein
MQIVSTERVYPFECTPKDLLSPEKAIKESIHGAPVKRGVRNAWYASPFLQVVTSRFARMFTHRYPFDGTRMLLEVAIENAVESYEGAAKYDLHQEQRESAYLKGLLGTIRQASEWVVIGIEGSAGNGTLVWRPGMGALLDWVRAERFIKIAFEPVVCQFGDEKQKKAHNLVVLTNLLGDERPEVLIETLELLNG